MLTAWEGIHLKQKGIRDVKAVFTQLFFLGVMHLQQAVAHAYHTKMHRAFGVFQPSPADLQHLLIERLEGDALDLLQHVLDEPTIDLDTGSAVGWGQTYEAAADIFNFGDTEANNITLAVVLSDDSQYDEIDDLVLSTLTIPSLPSGQISINDLPFTMPAEGEMPDGPYHMFLAVDCDIK